MDRSIYHTRIDALRRMMACSDRSGPDTVWIIQPENRRYLSGFQAGDMQLTESSGSLLINDARCLLVTDSRYTSEAEKEAADFEIQTLPQGVIDGFPGLLSLMETRTLGFEKDYLTWGLHEQLSDRLQSLLPPVVLTPLNGFVEQMRVIKDDTEIKALASSADLASAILGQIISGLKPGLTEKQVAWQIEDLSREAGADGLAFPSIVASGPNSALPHAVPTERKLREKEPIILDMGVRLGGYCSDMTRTVFLGDPDVDLKEIYRTVREAQIKALGEIRPGVESNHLDSIARKVIHDAGFGKFFGHALGHGVGLATHEQPRLGPLKPTKLKKGMVVTVEPGIYIPDKGGVRLEEMVIVEENGPRILTRDRHFYDFTS